jgi:hypothetical protein
MLLSAVSVLVVEQSSSEIPEGLTNNPVQNIPTLVATKLSNIIFFHTLILAEYV